jgi:hypothetical protein
MVVFAAVAAVVTSGCNYQNTPTAPGNAANPPGGTSTSGSNSSAAAAAAAFTGTWASSSIAGLPIGTCSDLKWTITAQTATSISGNVSATCAGGATVSANLTGQMQGQSTMTMTASGTMTMAGVPCPFNLVGTGTRQADDTMKLDYAGTYCLGNLSGSEVLRRFPNI